MGIKDLLRFMKPYIEPVHIKKYAGKRVGIDAYSWLHKGAYSCSMELSLDTEGRKKLKYIDYFMHRINLLRHYKITPVVVFDGGNIPCKFATEQERHRRRKANRELAMEKLKEGNVKAASELFQRAISVTPAMAHQLIQILKSENVEFMVAPYEADAQLAYLACLEAEKGGIAAVITEDSDLLAYGCKAIVFKMDRFGNGEELVLENVFKTKDRKPSFNNFDKELFGGMCVLAGCDFLQSVPGIGIVKAHSFVSKYHNLDRVLSVLKIEKGTQMPEDYAKSFRQAVAVFQHARIYDSHTKKLKHMKPLPGILLELLDEELDFLGPELPPSVATAIAEGNLDPTNMEAFNSFPTSGRIQKLGKAESSIQETSGLVFTSHKTHHTIEPTTFPPSVDTSSVKKDLDSILTKREECAKEDSELHKLIQLQPKDYLTLESPDGRNSIQLKVPNNNPFKRNKVEEISLDQIKKNAAEELEVWFETKGEQSEMSFLTTQESLSRSADTISFKNRTESMIHLNQTPNSEIKQVSCGNLESQESVRTNTRKLSRVKGKGKHENLKTTSSCRSPENKKKTTILNFFSRV